MAIKVEELLSNIDKSCVAFGPCVRNDLAGSPHSDNIDIVVSDKLAQTVLTNAVKDSGYSLDKVKSYKANTYRRSQFTIDKNGKRGTLNVYSPNHDNGNFGEDDVIAARYSADVNRVTMDSAGFVDVIDGSSFDIDEVQSHIDEGEYKVCDDGFSESEAEELSSSGFNQTFAKKKRMAVKKPLPTELVEPLPVNKKNNVSTPMPEVKHQNKEIAKMGLKTDGFFSMVKADAENAAYRVAATQITNGTKGAILAIMAKQGQDSERVKTIADLLDTEFGSAILALIVGTGLTYAPHISEDARVKRLAAEFRVSGMATAGNAVMDTAVQYFLPVIMNALSALPEETADIKARITNPPENAKEEEDEEESAVAPPRKMQG